MLVGMSMHANKDSRRTVRDAMREASELPQPSIVDVDPEEPSQLLDDAGQYSTIDLETEARPHAEADAELDAAVEATAESDSIDVLDQRDVGDLYGVHMPRAADSDLDVSDDQESFEDSTLGEHMFETLEKKMAEGGAEPEMDLEIEDDSDPDAGHSKTDRRDRPVADKGAGGPAGR
jgi:hypothetical protein